MIHQYEYTYLSTIMLIGDTDVGKSNIFARIKGDPDFWRTPNTFPTIGTDLCVAYEDFGDQRLRLHCWDASGHKGFRNFITRYYSRANGFLLIYDITKRESFQNLTSWLEELKVRASPNAVYVLLGNCCDLEEERQVSYEEGRKFAEGNNMVFFEVSAKTGENLRHAMKTFGRKLIDLKQKENELRKEIALKKQSFVYKVEIVKIILQNFGEKFVRQKFIIHLIFVPIVATIIFYLIVNLLMS